MFAILVLLACLYVCTNAFIDSAHTGLRVPVHRSANSRRSFPNKIQRRTDGALAAPIDYDQYWGDLFLNVTVGGQNQQLYVSTYYADTQVLASRNLSICSFGYHQCDHGTYDPSASTTFKNITNFPGFDLSSGNQTLTGYYFEDNVVFNGTNSTDVTMALVTNDTSEGSVPVLGLGLPQSESFSYTEGADSTYPGFLNSLKSQGLIKSLSYSLWTDPAQLVGNDLPNATQYEASTLLFGAIDSTAFQSDLQVYPIPINTGDNRRDYLSLTLYSARVWLNSSNYAGTDTSSNGVLAGITYDSWYSYLPSAMLDPIFAALNVSNNETNGPICDCGISANDSTSRYIYFDFAAPDVSSGEGRNEGFRIPISTFLSPLYLNSTATTPETFPNGSTICQFALSASDSNYEAEIGSAMLRALYVAVDYESNQIGLAFAASSTDAGGGVPSSATQVITSTALIPGLSTIPSAATTVSVSVTSTQPPLTQTQTMTRAVTVTATPTGNGGHSSRSEASYAKILAMTVLVVLALLEIWA